MLKIVFTKHALKKFADLRRLKIIVSKSQIINIISNPLYLDNISDYPNQIAQGSLDQDRILRIVFRTEDDRILVITFYPAKKGRYN